MSHIWFSWAFRNLSHVELTFPFVLFNNQHYKQWLAQVVGDCAQAHSLLRESTDLDTWLSYYIYQAEEEALESPYLLSYKQKIIQSLLIIWEKNFKATKKICNCLWKHVCELTLSPCHFLSQASLFLGQSGEKQKLVRENGSREDKGQRDLFVSLNEV